MQNGYKRLLHGFSLTELSVVLTIIAIIIAGGVTLSDTKIEQKKMENTYDELKAIEDALKYFVKENNRLPCPARLDRPHTDAEYGREALDCADSSPPSGLIRVEYPASSGTYVRIGGVPFYALGLPDEYLADEWHGRYLYAVPETFTAVISNEDTGIITVQDDAATAIDDTIAWVLLSHGASGKGAYTAKGGAIVTACDGTAKDGENCDGDGVFIDGLFNDGGVAASFYDDFLRWGDVFSLYLYTAAAGSETNDGCDLIVAGEDDTGVVVINKLNGNTGSLTWTENIHTLETENVSIDNTGNIYTVSDDSDLKKLDEDGAVLWTNGDHTDKAQAVAWSSTGHVYTGSDDNKLYKHNASDGVKVWEHDFGNDIKSVVIDKSNPGFIIVGGNFGVAKIAQDKTVSWTNTDNVNKVTDVDTDDSGNVYVSSWDDDIRKLNGATGAELWSYSTPADAEGVAYTGGTAFGTSATYVYKLNAATGALMASLNADVDTIRDIAYDDNGFLYVTADGGNVVKITAASLTKNWTVNHLTEGTALGVDMGSCD